MDRLELVQRALERLGQVSPQKLSAYIEQAHGVKIESRFIPVFTASIRDKERLTAARRVARAAAQQAIAELPRGAVRPTSPRAWQVQQLALELIAAHDLPGWTFAFNRRKQALGMCLYDRKTIELSIYFVERDNSAAEIRDTILHEIAHALVGPGHGHDAVWQRKCVEVGARPEACSTANMPEGRWQARCGGCGECFHRHRKPKRMRAWFCPDCGPALGKLVWRDTAGSEPAPRKAG